MRPLPPLPDTLPEIGTWVTQIKGTFAGRTGRVVAVEAPPHRWQWAIRPPRYRVLWKPDGPIAGTRQAGLRVRGVASWLHAYWTRAASPAEIEAAGAWPMPEPEARRSRKVAAR